MKVTNKVVSRKTVLLGSALLGSALLGICTTIGFTNPAQAAPLDDNARQYRQDDRDDQYNNDATRDFCAASTCRRKLLPSTLIVQIADFRDEISRF